MGFFDQAFKHPGWYAGGILPGLAMNNFGQPESNPLAPVRSKKAATASDIGMDSTLAKTLGQIGTDQSAKVSGVYNGMKDQANNDARTTGSYYTDRLATGEGISQGNLKSSLEAVLGDEGYSDWKSNRDYNENMDLARYTGELNAPSTLEEVLGALNGVSSTAGNLYGAFGGAKKSKTAPKTNVASSSGAGASGWSPDFGYYYE